MFLFLNFDRITTQRENFLYHHLLRNVEKIVGYVGPTNVENFMLNSLKQKA